MKTVYIILAFCAGLFTSYLLFNHDADNPMSTSGDGETATVKLNRIDSVKTTNDTVLAKRNTLLANQLLIVNEQLKDSRSALVNERKKIKATQTEILNDTLTARDSTQRNLCLQIDTLNRITDSIISNYERKLIMIGNIVALRDSQLVFCNKSYMDVRNLADEQIARERQLTIQLNTSLKQQNKNRVQNRLLTLSLLFVSGVTTSLILKSKQ